MKVKAKNPNGLTVVFNEEDHTYIIEETKQKLKSCTQFIHEFIPEFEKDRISKRVAEKCGLTQEEILQQWEDEKNLACDLGTQVHAYAESFLLGNKLPKITNEKAKIFLNGLDPVLAYLKNEYELVDSEKIIFSPRLGISGTIDLLMRKGNRIYIFDWKTNKKIKTEGFNHQKCLYPIEHLEDCNLNHYSLQLNIYKTILIEEDYYPKDTKYSMCLFHISEKGIEPYKVKHMDNEVWSMIKK